MALYFVNVWQSIGSQRGKVSFFSFLLAYLDSFFSKVKYGKMLEHMISWKVYKLFAQEFSNVDLGLTLCFCMARSNLPPGLVYGKRSWILQMILVRKLINTVG